MKILFLLAALVVNFSLFSQLTVDNTMTPQQLVQNILAGSGVTVSNVTFSGSLLSLGSFNGTNSNIGFSSGIILTNGDIQNAIGPNDEVAASTAFGGPGDSDMDQILFPTDSHDAGVLEFDFIPISDTVTFRYVFASEEYMEYANTGISDAFGFFISGPGINGPFSNNAVNIALIPGTAQPVSIDNVNLNFFPQFYFDNETPAGLSVQFDGFTIPLEAVSPVQCGQTYHLKLVITDGSDDIIDSGVFLEAYSLSSNGLNISLATVTGDSIIYEDCTDAQFIFTRPVAQLADTNIIYYTLSGSATEGVDYTDLVDSILFLPGFDTVAVSLNAFQDGVLEGNEVITISASYVSECGDTIHITEDLLISEEPIFDAIVNAPIVFCATDSVIMTAQAIGGTPPYHYVWSNGNVGDTAYGEINGVGTATFYFTVTDSCHFTFQDSVTITQMDPPPLTMSTFAPLATCIDDSVLMEAFAGGGAPPYTYSWSNGGSGEFVYGLTAGFPTYTVVATDICLGTMSQDITIQPAPDPVIMTFGNDVQVSCPSTAEPMSLFAFNGFGPYTYNWNDGQTGENIVGSISVMGSVDYIVNITDVCGFTAVDTLTLSYNQDLQIDLMTQVPTSPCLDNGQTNATVSGISGFANYTWTGPGQNTQVVSFNSNASFLDSGWYYLNVQDGTCVINDSIHVGMSAFTLDIQTMTQLPSSPCLTNGQAAAIVVGNTNFVTYSWHGPGTNGPALPNLTPNIQFLASGWYYVNVSEDNCHVNDSVFVNQTAYTLSIDSLNMDPTVNCEPTGQISGFFSGNTNPATFSWHGPGKNGPVVSTTNTAVQNLATGWYYFEVDEDNCQETDSIFVGILDAVNASFTSDVLTGTIPIDINFTNQSANGDSFDWNFGNGDSISVNNTGAQSSSYNAGGLFDIILIAYQGNCTDTAKLQIELFAEPSVFIPNIFTPNNDKLNDYFSVFPTNFATFNIVVVNRWGNVVFEGNLADPAWHGLTQNGDEAGEGSYFYEYSGVGLNGESLEGSGFFQLTR